MTGKHWNPASGSFAVIPLADKADLGADAITATITPRSVTRRPRLGHGGDPMYNDFDIIFPAQLSSLASTSAVASASVAWSNSDNSTSLIKGNWRTFGLVASKLWLQAAKLQLVGDPGRKQDGGIRGFGLILTLLDSVGHSFMRDCGQQCAGLPLKVLGCRFLGSPSLSLGFVLVFWLVWSRS